MTFQEMQKAAAEAIIEATGGTLPVTASYNEALLLAAAVTIVSGGLPANVSNAQIAGYVANAGVTKDALDGSYETLLLTPDGITYNSDGSVASSTSQGIATAYTYNSDGTVSTESRLGKVKTWAYDTAGNPTGSVVV